MNYSRSTKQIFIEQFHVWGFDQCQQRKMYSVINSNKKGLWLGLLHDFHRTELCILVNCFFLYVVEFAWFVVYFFFLFIYHLDESRNRRNVHVLYSLHNFRESKLTTYFYMIHTTALSGGVRCTIDFPPCTHSLQFRTHPTGLHELAIGCGAEQNFA